MAREFKRPEDGEVISQGRDGLLQFALVGRRSSGWPISWWGRLVDPHQGPLIDPEGEVQEEPLGHPSNFTDDQLLEAWRSHDCGLPEFVWVGERRLRIYRIKHIPIWLTRGAIFKVTKGRTPSFSNAYKTFLSELNALPIAPCDEQKSYLRYDARKRLPRVLWVRYSDTLAAQWWFAFLRLRWRISRNPLKFLSWLVEDHGFVGPSLAARTLLLLDPHEVLGSEITPKQVSQFRDLRLNRLVSPMSALKLSHDVGKIDNVISENLKPMRFNGSHYLWRDRPNS